MSHILFIMAEGGLFDMESFYGTHRNSLQERYDAILDLIESKFTLNVDPQTRIKYRDNYLSGIEGKLIEGQPLNNLTMICSDFATILATSKSQKACEKQLLKDPSYRIKNQLLQLEKRYHRREPMLTKGGYMFTHNTQLLWASIHEAFRDSARHAPSFIEGFAQFNLFKAEQHNIRVVILTEGKPELIRTYLRDRCYTEGMFPPIEHVSTQVNGKLDKLQLRGICKKYVEEQSPGECQLFIASNYKRHIKKAIGAGLVPVYMSKDSRVVEEFNANYEGYQIKNYHSLDAVLKVALQPQEAEKACDNQWTKIGKGDTNPFQRKLI